MNLDLKKLIEISPSFYYHTSTDTVQGIFENGNDYFMTTIHNPRSNDTSKNITTTSFRGNPFEAIEVQTSGNSNVYEILKNIRNTLYTKPSPTITRKKFSESNCTGLTQLMDELIALNRDEFDVSLSHKTTLSPYEIFVSNFRDNENHFIKFELPQNLNGMIVVDSSLPVDDAYWTKSMVMAPTHHLPLRYMIDSFRATLTSLDKFYNCMGTIDTLCYVVDPEVITTKSTWRTFKFNDRVHLRVSVEPFDSSAFDIKFIGPTADIQGLRDLYEQKVNDWDMELDIYRNLLRTFDLMYFPMQPSNESMEAEEERQIICSICYMNRCDEGKLPLVICDNRKCGLFYHAKCLQQWFATTKKSKTFFSVTFGACPYCQTKISPSYIDLYST